MAVDCQCSLNLFFQYREQWQKTLNTSSQNEKSLSVYLQANEKLVEVSQESITQRCTTTNALPRKLTIWPTWCVLLSCAVQIGLLLFIKSESKRHYWRTTKNIYLHSSYLYFGYGHYFLFSVLLPVPSSEVHLRRSKNNIPRARLRTLKMSVVIVLSFIICWTPYYLLGLWYWFFPDDLEGKVSHSLTHILFIFGLLNACLDPVIYGLFTIHFRKGLLRYFCNATKASNLDNNTIITGSFTCATTSVSLKREVTHSSQERFMLCIDKQSKAKSFLTADEDKTERASTVLP